MYPGKWASKFPDKPAIIHSQTGESVSFGELNSRSNQLAHLLHADGLRRGDHIAIFMENHLRYFEICWAALRSGLYITTVNRYLTNEEAGYIIDNCEAKALITSKRLEEIAVSLPEFAPNCQRWLMLDGTAEGYDAYESAIASMPESNLAQEPTGAFMLYSSGTTGRPKGISRPLPDTEISADTGAVGGLQQALWGFDSNTVYLSPAPLYHSAPIGFCTAALALGGTIVMMPRFDPVESLQAIEKYKVTHSQWVPTMFTRMLKLPEAERSGFDLSSLKVAIHAAAPCPREVKQQMLDWWGPVIYEYYAGTELNGFTHVTPEAWLAKPGTVGQPILGVIHICDDDGNELPAGQDGIVYFELPEMPFVYHKDEGKTKDTQHPKHANWTALGDVGYVDEDGYLFLTDRATFMIISGGVNIYPQEIEDAMVMHPKIADVAVVGVPDPEMGEAVKAVVQLADGLEASDDLEAELVAYAREHIAHYKCPKSIDFMEELPRLPTGKLYKRILKDNYWGKTGSKIV
ncbi:MAG: AMP-binding protein [Pseudomonadaceae bacterium]|nr:AMP-binding protein [Pseudomonadaceae bacterium]